MRLAYHKDVKLGDYTLTMRPTLRAASSLLERYGSFGAIAVHIEKGTWTTIRDVLSTCGAHCNSNEMKLGMIEGAGLGAVLIPASNAVIDLLFDLAGHDRDAKAVESKGPKITVEEAQRRLFAIATGWLGYTPEAAWNSTPAEIIAAYNGLIEKLRAIHGGKDDKPQDITAWDGTDLEPDRGALADLKVMQ